MKPEIKVINLETGEEIVREMNNDEFKQYEKDIAEAEAKAQAEAEAEALKTAAKAKLAVLGLTTDDLKALGL